MKTIRYYIADDGKEFEDFKDCKEYEESLNHINDIKNRMRMLNYKGFVIQDPDYAHVLYFETDKDAQSYIKNSVANGEMSNPFAHNPDKAHKGIYIWDIERESWYELDKLENFITNVKARIEMVKTNPKFDAWQSELKWPEEV